MGLLNGAARGLLPPFLWGPRRENGWQPWQEKGGTLFKAASWPGTQPSAGQRAVFTTNSPKSICYANLHSSQSPIQPNQYANLLLCPMQGRVAAHLFRLDVKPCAVARRKAEIDTRASAPHGH